MKRARWTSSRTCVYNIFYHLVWSTKYRKSILNGPITKALTSILDQIASENNFTIVQQEIMPDHVHLFASAHPKYAPGAIVKKLKGISGKRLFLQFPELRKVYRRHQIWNPSTYYGTAGDMSKSVIEKYIQMQKTKTDD
ncbi:MAG: IS200/IS605 family transposase [Syntrophorhabdales bacterium]|jgi:putative transposase